MPSHRSSQATARASSPPMPLVFECDCITDPSYNTFKILDFRPEFANSPTPVSQHTFFSYSHCLATTPRCGHTSKHAPSTTCNQVVPEDSTTEPKPSSPGISKRPSAAPVKNAGMPSTSTTKCHATRPSHDTALAWPRFVISNSRSSSGKKTDLHKAA